MSPFFVLFSRYQALGIYFAHSSFARIVFWTQNDRMIRCSKPPMPDTLVLSEF